MRKLLLFLALVNATALAASAQMPQTPGHGLTLGRPDWTSVGVTATSPGPVGGQGGGGGRGGRYANRSSADYQPHMAQALANAYAQAYPRPAPSSSVGGARILRHASVALTNEGAKTVKSVRLDFVFTDPSTGAEVNRIRHRSKKTLRPGESVTTKKEVIASPRHRRGDGMKVSAELTEVVYADGSVWRR